MLSQKEQSGQDRADSGNSYPTHTSLAHQNTPQDSRFEYVAYLIRAGSYKELQQVCQSEQQLLAVRGGDFLQIACRTVYPNTIRVLVSVMNAGSLSLTNLCIGLDLAQFLVFIERLVNTNNIKMLQEFICLELKDFFNVTHLSGIYGVLKTAVEDDAWLNNRSFAHIVAEHVTLSEDNWAYFRNLNIHTPNLENIYPIHLAAHADNVKFIDLVVNYAQNDALKVMDAQGNQPIHHAAKYGSVGFVVKLAQFRVSLQTRDGEGRTPQEIALSNNQSPVLEALMEAQKLQLDLLSYINAEDLESAMEFSNKYPAFLYQTHTTSSPLIVACQKSLKNFAAFFQRKMMDMGGFIDFLHTVAPVDITTEVAANILEMTVRFLDKNTYEACRAFTRRIPDLGLVVKNNIIKTVRTLARGDSPIKISYTNDVGQHLIVNYTQKEKVSVWDLSKERLINNFSIQGQNQIFVTVTHLVVAGCYYSPVIITLIKTGAKIEYNDDGISEGVETKIRPVTVADYQIAFAIYTNSRYEIVLWNLQENLEERISVPSRPTTLGLLYNCLVVGTCDGMILQVFFKQDCQIKIFTTDCHDKEIAKIRLQSPTKLICRLENSRFFVKSLSGITASKQKVADFDRTITGDILTLSEKGVIKIRNKLGNCVYKISNELGGKIVDFFVHPKGYLVTVENELNQVVLRRYNFTRKIEVVFSSIPYVFEKNLLTGVWTLPAQFSFNTEFETVLSRIHDWKKPSVEALSQLKNVCHDYICQPFLYLSAVALGDAILNGIVAADFSAYSKAEMFQFFKFFQVETFSISSNGEYLLYLAAKANNFLLVSYILEVMNENIHLDTNQVFIQRAIKCAIDSDGSACLSYLLGKFNKPWDEGKVAFLLLAVNSKSKKCLEVLLNNGCRRDIDKAIRLIDTDSDMLSLLQESKNKLSIPVLNAAKSPVFGRVNSMSGDGQVQAVVLGGEEAEDTETSVHHHRKLTTPKH